MIKDEGVQSGGNLPISQGWLGNSPSSVRHKGEGILTVSQFGTDRFHASSQQPHSLVSVQTPPED